MSLNPFIARLVLFVVAGFWWGAYSFHLWHDEWFGFPAFLSGLAVMVAFVFWERK